jgi:predicted nucleotidyltransferase
VTAEIDLRDEDREIVVTILRDILPKEARVHVFGSRAGSLARPASDLDLAIDISRPLSLDEHAALNEGFEESDLPYKVDIIDLHSVSSQFKSLIAGGAKLLIGKDPPS